MYLGTSPKQKTSIVVGITQCQSPYWTLNALHCVIYCHCWCYLWHGEHKNTHHQPFKTMYVQTIQQHLFMSSKCWKNNTSTLLADVDNRRKGMMRCTSPPGLLMYKYKGFVLSTLSRYSMVARIWLPNSSSIYWPMKIMRSRYCMQHFVGVSTTTTINPPKNEWCGSISKYQ